jgi:predicted Ser/Thr protein kinase
MPDISPLQPEDPARLGSYTLIGRLGRGGYGVVYLAETPRAERVAVKLLQTALAEAGGERERFGREAAAAKQVARFCTAQVIDADIAGDKPYIVSEYVEGPSLQALVQERGPLSGGALDRLAIGTATALVAIHQAGVVHRDLKPPNVLMGPDGPRVIDFGIARMMAHAATQTAHALGTPAYMAPEQVTGREITPAVDVFAWAATVAFAANGLPPFGRDTLAVLAHRILHEEPDLGALSGPLRALVADCLAKDPARRPAAGVLLMRLLGHDTVPGVDQAQQQAQAAILAEGVTAAAAVTPAIGMAETMARPAGPAQPAGSGQPVGLAQPPVTERPPQKRRGWALALTGALAAAAVAAATVAGLTAFRDDGGPRTVPGRTTTISTTVTPKTVAEAPRDDRTPSSAASHPQDSRPVLIIQISGCDLGATATTCTVTLRASGATISWTATAGDPLSLSATSGSLSPGESTTVTITLHASEPRESGSGTVTFAGGGSWRTVHVTWESAPTPDPSSSY